MSIATLPEAPPTSPPAPPPEAIPRQTPAHRYAPREADAPRRPRHGGVLGGLILIALGIVVLGGTWFPRPWCLAIHWRWHGVSYRTRTDGPPRLRGSSGNLA